MKVLLILAVGLLSFANGANDNFKEVATLWGAGLTTYRRAIAWATGFTFLGSLTAIWLGGALGAVRVAHTLSKKITPMGAREAVTANLVAAALVTLASPFALPVSTTHVTSGGIFGIGLLRRHEADWSRVRDILLSWVATLPLAAVVASIICKLLLMSWS